MRSTKTLAEIAMQGCGMWSMFRPPPSKLALFWRAATFSALGTRTLDTLHVACALELKAERFWTFDQRQAKLAKAAGLKTS